MGKNIPTFRQFKRMNEQYQDDSNRDIDNRMNSDYDLDSSVALVYISKNKITHIDFTSKAGITSILRGIEESLLEGTDDVVKVVDLNKSANNAAYINFGEVDDMSELVVITEYYNDNGELGERKF